MQPPPKTRGTSGLSSGLSWGVVGFVLLGLLVAGHFGQPVENTDCARCHDLKNSKASYAIYKYTHGPFAGRHCDECHGPPRNGKVTLSTDRINDLCFGCHVQLKNRLMSEGSPHRLLKAHTCTECHDPHTSPYPWHLVNPRKAICAPCHAGMPEDTKFPH
jgi:predicted CXXCH cytochrome family protein